MLYDGEMATLFTPGEIPEFLEFNSNKRIIYHDKIDGSTSARGGWHKWTLQDNTTMLSITFNGNGSEALHDLRVHLFYEVIPGVYRNVTQWQRQVLLFPSGADATYIKEPFKLNVAEVFPPDVKHSFLWLQPGRWPSVILFLFTGQVVLHEMKEPSQQAFTLESDDDNTCFYENSIVNSFWLATDNTFLTFSFQMRGHPTKTIMTC